jgi:hypothetical protein
LKPKGKARDYYDTIKAYKVRIENVLRDLKPMNMKLAVLGIAIAIGSISPVLIILSNSMFLDQRLQIQYYVLFFICFILFFVGYILLHRSITCEWL